jgi:hypothetical protein
MAFVGAPLTGFAPYMPDYRRSRRLPTYLTQAHPHPVPLPEREGRSGSGGYSRDTEA